MARYEIRIKASAAKEIAKIGTKRDRLRMLRKVEALADQPRPPGCTKLSGSEHYRVRLGKYRIVYAIRDRELVVLIIRVGQWSDIYRTK